MQRRQMSRVALKTYRLKLMKFRRSSAIASLIDFFFRCDHTPLGLANHGLTDFIFKRGWKLEELRATSFLQRATKSVTQFVRAIAKTLEVHIPEFSKIFVHTMWITCSIYHSSWHIVRVIRVSAFSVQLRVNFSWLQSRAMYHIVIVTRLDAPPSRSSID